jgi:PPOX class probable F420-dependent enzyme
MTGGMESARTVSLATFRRDGRQVDTPVWVVMVGDRLYVNTESASAKVKRIRNNPRIRMAPSTMGGRPLAEWREGTARLVDDAGLVRRVNEAIRAKYGLQARIYSLFALFSRRVRERTIVEVQLSP